MAHGAKLGDLVKYIGEEQYSYLNCQGHPLVPYHAKELGDVAKQNEEGKFHA